MKKLNITRNRKENDLVFFNPTSSFLNHCYNRIHSISAYFFLSIFFLFFIYCNQTNLYAQGLHKGANVSYFKKGVAYHGVVTKVTLGDKEAMTTVSNEGKPVKLFLKDIKKIEKTGKKWKLTPNWSYTESDYDVYTFTSNNGQDRLLGIAQWPVWDITLAEGTQTNNLWLEHLDWIVAETEMSASVQSIGLITGSSVSYLKNGVSYSGIVSKVTLGEKEAMNTVSQDGKQVKLFLRDVIRIEKSEQKWKLTPNWTYTESTYQVYTFSFSNGQTRFLGITQWPVWDITLTDGTESKNIWLEQIEWIGIKK